MEEHINNKIANKIKEVLQNHEEDYQEGAWENFLAKKKEKKRRIAFWYFRGLAASVLILLGICLWGRLPNTPYGKNKVTKEEFKCPPLKEEKTNKELFESQTTKTVSNPKETNQPKDPVNKENNLKPHNLKKANSKYVNTYNEHKNNDAAHQIGKSGEKEFIEEKEKKNTVSYHLKQAPNRHGKSHILKGNEKAIVLNAKGVKEFRVRPSSSLKKGFLVSNNKNLVANDLEYFIKAMDSHEEIDKLKNKIQLGVLVSPGFGSGSDNAQSIASSNLGAGLELNIPINNSKISFNTGSVFNALYITNNKTTKNGEFSGNSEITKNYNKTNVYNVDIPFNFRYTLPKNKIYFQAGVSSYVTFKESTNSTSTFIREVEVFQFNDGVIESYTTNESVTTQETSKNNEVRFTSLGTINLSIGYKARMSNNLNYEIQPFYKYPLNAISNQSNKIHSAGISLKLFFSK